MTIVFINPNSTQAMTRAMLASARAAVPGAAFEGWTSTGGPAAIEGPQDGDRAVPPLLHLVQKASDDGAAAIVIGCFDDTCLAEARALAGARFSVVTTLSVSVPILENNIRSYGLSGALVRVRASGVRVLDLEGNPAEATPRVLAEMHRAVEMDGVESVVLGCAGMVTLLEAARAEIPVNVIDGVEAAARLAWALSMVRQ